MKQVLQSLRTGATDVAEVPCPALHSGQLLIRSSRTLISAGTERMLVEFGKASWLGKARQQPERLRQVLDKISTDGLMPTVAAVFSKLDEPLPLGYCNVGRVLEVGAADSGFAVGERVVSNGNHAEIVSVATHLSARIPDGVADDEAVFAVPAAIALQGIRLVQPTLGEGVVVIGLGLIGLLCVQLLRAQGCRVMGIDPDTERAELARRFGAEVVSTAQDPVTTAAAFSRGRGVDAAIITASTQSNEPVHQAAVMCRQRGRIVLVGVTGLQLARDDFYKKELTFQVSCSYGPGRYDSKYEKQGFDYPIGFVRWTAQRNFEAVLDLMAAKRLDTLPLISHRFALERAPEAYGLLLQADSRSLGIVIEYPRQDVPQLPDRVIGLPATVGRPATDRLRVAFIGAGSYARRTLIPAFAAAGVQLAAIASDTGVSAAHCGRKFGFGLATSDADGLTTSTDVDVVVIATRHDSHARFALQALGAGKHVFVEKPLAITAADLDAIAAVLSAGGTNGDRPQLMVGFNRRFAPHATYMRTLLAHAPEPKSVIVTVNAGALPPTHWVRDPAVGGGRLVGEACHFVDLLRFLIAQPIVQARVHRANATSGGGADQSFMISLGFADGSSGVVHYLVNGHTSFPKERIEVFCAGRVLQLDNFRRLRGYGWPHFRSMRLWRQDKGQKACARAFVEAATKAGPPPIPLEEIIEVSRVVVSLSEGGTA